MRGPQEPKQDRRISTIGRSDEVSCCKKDPSNIPRGQIDAEFLKATNQLFRAHRLTRPVIVPTSCTHCGFHVGVHLIHREIDAASTDLPFIAFSMFTIEHKVGVVTHRFHVVMHPVPHLSCYVYERFNWFVSGDFEFPLPERDRLKATRAIRFEPHLFTGEVRHL